MNIKCPVCGVNNEVGFRMAWCRSNKESVHIHCAGCKLYLGTLRPHKTENLVHLQTNGDLPTVRIE